MVPPCFKLHFSDYFMRLTIFSLVYESFTLLLLCNDVHLSWFLKVVLWEFWIYLILFTIHPPTLPRSTPLPVLPHFSSHQTLCPFSPHQGPFVLPKYSWMSDIPLEYIWFIKSCALRENQPFHSQQLRNASSSGMGIGFGSTPFFMLEFSRSCACHHSCCDSLLYSFPALSRTQLLPYSHLSPLTVHPPTSFLPPLLP